jgi:3-dehydroquinate synthase
MASSVCVDLGERAYSIRIEPGAVPGFSIDAEPGNSVLIVTDTTVGRLYGETCRAALAKRGFQVAMVTVPAGEASKSLQEAARVYRAALGAGLDRRSIIVALGGGVVGDLAGFVAATYLRGVRLIQVPTSLLAMVDSSVGGKTAVNLPEGKNLVGVFHQPIEVAVDLATLDSLPEREYVSGLAEIVKYGVIWDAVFFQELEANVDGLLRRDAALLERVVARCCEIKAEVVAVDEKESGVRAILNFGHTLGHALEKLSEYDRWLHGEAVAMGMAYAADVSVATRGFPGVERDRLLSFLKTCGLPVAPPSGERPPWVAVRNAMAADKKTLRAVPRFVLAETLGSVVYGCEISEESLAAAYGTWGQRTGEDAGS